MSEMVERIGTLYDAIAHGDNVHRAWLKEAIENHFEGRRVPPPRDAKTDRMTNISDETVQRMVECNGRCGDSHIGGGIVQRMADLVRKIADQRSGYFAPATCLALDEARAIVAQLPKPVDPDELAVRGILGASNGDEEVYLSGKWDREVHFQRALAAFKRVTGGGA